MSSENYETALIVIQNVEDKLREFNEAADKPKLLALMEFVRKLDEFNKTKGIVLKELLDAVELDSKDNDTMSSSYRKSIKEYSDKYLAADKKMSAELTLINDDKIDPEEMSYVNKYLALFVEYNDAVSKMLDYVALLCKSAELKKSVKEYDMMIEAVVVGMKTFNFLHQVGEKLKFLPDLLDKLLVFLKSEKQTILSIVKTIEGLINKK